MRTVPIVTVSRFGMTRSPNASIRRAFDATQNSTAHQEIEYVSFYFWDDDEPADVAWTFAIPEG